MLIIPPRLHPAEPRTACDAWERKVHAARAASVILVNAVSETRRADSANGKRFTRVSGLLYSLLRFDYTSIIVESNFRDI